MPPKRSQSTAPKKHAHKSSKFHKNPQHQQNSTRIKPTLQPHMSWLANQNQLQHKAQQFAKTEIIPSAHKHEINNLALHLQEYNRLSSKEIQEIRSLKALAYEVANMRAIQETIASTQKPLVPQKEIPSHCTASFHTIGELFKNGKKSTLHQAPNIAPPATG